MVDWKLSTGVPGQGREEKRREEKEGREGDVLGLLHKVGPLQASTATRAGEGDLIKEGGRR